MTINHLHKITIYFKQAQRKITLQVPHGENILRHFEENGEKLPFSCRNGCCTTCAVKILSGEIEEGDKIKISSGDIGGLVFENVN